MRGLWPPQRAPHDHRQRRGERGDDRRRSPSSWRAKAAPMSEPIFPRLALIGIGLIGSSIALAARQAGLAGHIAINSRTPATLERAERAEPRRQLPRRPGRRRARRRLRHPLRAGRRLGRGRGGDRAGAEARRHRLRRRLGQGARSSRRCSHICRRGFISCRRIPSPARNIPGPMPVSPSSSRIAGAS